MPPRFAFRASKFRNLECTPAAREASYDQLHVTSAAVEGSAVAAALERWAFAHQLDGGAAIQVKALSDTGKDAATLPPLLRGHQARVNALEFSPFRSDVLLSGSADATVKVWKLPSDATAAELPSAASATLSGAQAASSVVGVRHHPSAAQLAVAVSHRDVLVWDLEAEALACHVTPLDGSDDDALSSVAWNYDGSALVTSSLLQHVRVLDPRADAVVEMFQAHTGRRRPTSVAWCGRLDLLVTAGCDAVQERELKLWDLRHTAKPLARERLDASIGQLFPLYDADVDLLYVLGKGDRSVRAFEVDAAGLHKLSQTLLPHMTLGAALLPKQACDTRVCEVARVLSLSANGGGSSGVCDVLSFTVPRRDARSEFQRDLYPDTLARAPALTPAQWVSGESAMPVLERVAPSDSTGASAAPANGGHGSVFGFTAPGWGVSAPAPPSQPQVQAVASAPSSSSSSGPSNGWGNAAASPWASTTSSAWGASTASPDKPTPASSSTSGWASKTTAWNAAAPAAAPSVAATAANPVQWFTPEPLPSSPAENAEAAAKAAAESAEKIVSQKIARFTTSQGHKLKYIKGTQSTRNDTLNIGDKAAASSCIRANASHMAIPLQGAGGPVLVSPLSATGRVGTDALVLDGQKATVTDVAFHTFDDNILATGSGDATVAVWKLNGESSTPHTVLRGHTKGVRSLEFHPRAADVLCSTAQDLSIRLWDVQAGAEHVCLSDKLEDFVWNTAFSPDGSLLATSSRERLVRVFDPRAAHEGHALVAMGCGFDSMRPQFVSWLSPSQLVTLGTTGAPRHETQLRIWDARNLVDPVSTTTIDAAAAESTLLYDASSRVLFLASTGGRQIWSYEISGGDGQAQAVHANLPFVADGLQPISAAALLPKRLCDVREAEIDRVLLLRGNVVEKVSFSLPRNEKLRAYFQDDVFGDIPTSTPSVSSSDWFAGAQAVVEYESLCPKGMTPLSEKPEEEKSVPMSQQFRAKWEAEEREKKLKAENLERLQALAAQPSLHVHGQAHAAASRQNDESDDDWDD